MSWRSSRSYFDYYPSRAKVDKSHYLAKHPEADPVLVEGRNIAKTFWGQRWCSHFENMADFENRLPRGRTYARQGAVCDLKIGPGKIEAVVAGSDFYRVSMNVKPLDLDLWFSLKQRCFGGIGAIVDLLMGRFSNEVMEIFCHKSQGLFPTTAEIDFKCSCPDSARLCKHIAAIFYGIGARLDTAPELLFLLRRVNPNELLTGETDGLTDKMGVESSLDGDLGAIFGIEIANDKGVKERGVREKLGTSSAPIKALREEKSRRPSDEELSSLIRSISESKKSEPLTNQAKADVSGQRNVKAKIKANDKVKGQTKAQTKIQVLASVQDQGQVKAKDKIKGQTKAQTKNQVLDPVQDQGQVKAKDKITGQTKAQAKIQAVKKTPVYKGAKFKPEPLDFDNLTSRDIKNIRDYSGLSVQEMALVLVVSPATIKRWETSNVRLELRSRTVESLKKWYSKLTRS
ncbi:MAG: SWIM zinc finger family protein [Deltaproteobacteria bacterium]|jgi:uncharacterized Zn finger protein/DNA-binding XRE family transcriptional regulator|nr:SWIM zinc finger family protein [Deltaproteobacteria bacterium]